MAEPLKKEDWWKKDEIVEDEELSAPADWWGKDEIFDERPQLPRPDESRLNPNKEAPHNIRVQLGALKKPEDRLKALRKAYPNAEPYGEDNFIMTDPETGETIFYNMPGFTMRDVSSVVPEIAEGFGALFGGIGGTVGGGAAGSAVPVIGTGAGAVSGAIAGAGGGGAAARDAAERFINYMYDNEDTRDTGEYLTDKAIDVGVNAAGEGAGMLLAKGVGSAYRGTKNQIAKYLTRDGDDAKKIAQTAKDFSEAGIPATVGTVSGSSRQAARENRLVDAYNPKVSQTVKELDEGLKSEFGRITDFINPNPGTRQSVGEAIQDAANESKDFINQRVGDLYKQTDDLAGSATTKAPNTTALNDALKTEKKQLSNSAKLNKGPYLDNTIKRTEALVKDARKGLTFREMQDAREELGRLAFAPDANPALKDYLVRARDAVSKDMEDAAKSVGGDAFDVWKQADEAYKSRLGPNGSDRVLNPLANSESGEQAYKMLTANLQHGGTRIAKVREVIEQANGSDMWSSVVRHHITELGSHTNADGAVEFAGNKFLQNWNKMAPEAKDAMFKGTPQSAAREDLDRLARLTDARKRATSASGGKPDAGTNMLLAWGTLGGYSAVKGVSNDLKARLATDPRIVKWFADIPIAQKNGALMDHSRVLRNIGRELSKEYGNDWAEDEINAFLNQMKPK